MRIDLSGKTALVTGGNVGIGRAIALALAESGADVAITYLSHAGDETVRGIEALGRQALALRLDATHSAAVNDVVAQVAAHFGGRIDILVNNAGGLVQRAPILEMSDQVWRRVFDVNVTSAFYCARAVVPYMNAGWGRIVNNGSIAAHHGGSAGAVAYSAAKAAIHTFTRGLAKELAPRGITVNAVAPGFILETPFHPTFTSKAARQAAIAQTALKRGGVPADVAGAVLYLVSDLATYVTGEIIEVNGGLWFA
jgi:3-oxoacyl-[acyl-carrier protein] reductase